MSAIDFNLARAWGAFELNVFDDEDPKADHRRWAVLQSVFDTVNENPAELKAADLINAMIDAFYDEEG